MTRRLLPLLLVLAVAACEPAPPTGAAPAAPPATSPPAASPLAPETTTAAPAATPASAYRVTYPWGVPSRPARTVHPLVAPPLPFLARVQVGDHPTADPPYTRITFAFEGGWPTYEIAYQRDVPAEGTGDPIPLPGNSFLRISFIEATGHDDTGRTTARPASWLGFPTLRGYGFGGDFEGHVTYGLGIQAAPASDQAWPIRVGELVRADGTHVVAVDVRRGG